MSQDAARPSVTALEALLAKARTLENSGKAAAALKLLQDAPAAMKAFGTWHYAVGALHLRANQPDKAIPAFEQAVKLEPEVSEFHSNLGAALLARFQAGGNKDAALLAKATATLTTAVELHPRLASPFNNLGHALLLAGKFPAALRNFETALLKEPEDIPALFNKAAALHALGREQECLVVLDRVLVLDPSCEPAKVSRANTLKRLGSKP